MTTPSRRLERPTRFEPWRALLLAAGAAALLSACSAVRPPAIGEFAEVGTASWYGIAERGRPTASGERMDPGKMTAAHPSLPFGTMVRVTDLDTGRAIEVRINDRGPFVHDRIIDLSHEAARRLGMLERGVAPVRVGVVSPAPRAVYTVQVGAYRSRQAATEVSRQLREHGYGRSEVVAGDGVHRVRIGRFSRRSEARALADGIRGGGYEAMIVRLRS